MPTTKNQPSRTSHTDEVDREERIVDPVCGMEITAGQAAGTSTYKGQTYYFCSTDCRTRFDSEPDEYAA